MKQVSDILIDIISRLTKIEDRLDKLEAQIKPERSLGDMRYEDGY